MNNGNAPFHFDRVNNHSFFQINIGGYDTDEVVVSVTWWQQQTLCCGDKGIARTQSPTNKNYALELPTFGVIVGVNPTGVQWKSLTLEEPPS